MKLPQLGELLRAVRQSGAVDLIERTLNQVGSRMPEGLKGMGRPQGRTEGPTITPAGQASAPPGRFLDRRLGDVPDGRSYKLYVPSRYRGQAMPLVVMLHGCTQSPDDFAVGTGMNRVAEDSNCLVAYPEQIASANSARCWNWFNRTNQQRDQGEPALIASITHEIMRQYAVDKRRVYVAGLSAGGAAASVMGAAYPDLYAAIGVHSGLACGAARNAASAFVAMRDGAEAVKLPRTVPAIVFHGDRDTTVNPRNADAVAAQFAPADPVRRTMPGQVPGGHAWEKTVLSDATGRVVLEQWTVRGLGHAWSGGNKAGSYTDPTGPDASREMLRFFLEHRLS